ncbi:MAG TPA: DUF423 domain-containing protein [Nevskia sp.]|nr:DUF423 domain-containing protein [Nevskia sp.]
MTAARLFLLIGAVYGLLGVVFGAFGAHALRARLTPEMLAVYHTGVEYQFYHAFGLLAVGVLCLVRPGPGLGMAGWCFAAGVLLFSGSLYLLALSGTRWLGAVTPLGGVLFLVGWGALLWAVLRSD